MLITVIVPTFNRAHFLPIAIHSLVRQCNQVKLDILIIDDGSSDETLSVVRTLQAQHSGLRYVWQKHSGVAVARNLGLNNLLPETEVVAFLDSDDASPMGRFAADLPHLLHDPSLDLTYGRLRMVNAIDPVTQSPPSQAHHQDACIPQLSLGLFRRGVIERTGFFDRVLRQSEDVDFLLRMFESGARFIQTETITLFYLRHSGNLTAHTAEKQRYFAAALLRSRNRRRDDPTRILRKPNFDWSLPVWDG